MNLAEYFDVEHILDGELKALSYWCSQHARSDGVNGAAKQ
jgi:hypothetical protein